MAYEEDWETSSGLALDGATVEIIGAEFGFNASLGAGITCANFVMRDLDGEEIEQSFSVGQNFEASRDGSELVGNAKINKNSNYGLLIESVKDILDNPGDVIGSPKVAANWIGTCWTFGSLEREVMNPTTKEKKVSTKFIVTEYHGRPDAPAGGAAKTAGATKKAAGGSASTSSSNLDVDPELFAELVELAKTHTDHEDFAAAALELDAVAESKAAQKAVMGSRAGSVWAAAQES